MASFLIHVFMPQLKCMEVTGLCDFVAEGATAEEAKSKLEAHGHEAHADALMAMTDEQKAEMHAKMDSMLSSQAM